MTTYISVYIYDLYTHKVLRKLKDNFDTPSIHPLTRPFGPRSYRGWHWTPKGHCGCLVENYFQITPCKSELLDPKMKSHLPIVNLKFFTTTPNLTSNFETIILVIFVLIFAMKPPKLLKNLKISQKKKLWNLGWFQWNPSNGFKGFKKTTFFQNYTSISRKNSTNVVEFYRDILVYFSKKCVLLKP